MKISLLFRTSIIPLCIHLVLWWLFYLLMIVRVEFFSYHAAEVSLAYWSWLWLAAILTAYINIIVTFKKEFGYYIIMSVPRRAFAWFYLKTTILYNVLVSTLIILDLNILRFLNHAYGFQEIDFLKIIFNSQTDFLIHQFLVIFGIMMLFSTLGAFVGSSTYRFGITFIWGFWLTFGLGTSILAIFSGAFGLHKEIVNSLLWFLGADLEVGVVSGSGHLLSVSVILSAITFLNINRIQLK